MTPVPHAQKAPARRGVRAGARKREVGPGWRAGRRARRGGLRALAWRPGHLVRALSRKETCSEYSATRAYSVGNLLRDSARQFARRLPKSLQFKNKQSKFPVQNTSRSENDSSKSGLFVSFRKRLFEIWTVRFVPKTTLRNLDCSFLTGEISEFCGH